MPENNANITEDKEKIIFKGKTELITKVIVIGDPAVGKTSLLTRFTSNKFEKKYLPTVGVNIVKEPIEVEDRNGKNAMVNIMFWDIAGQPQFYMLHEPYFKGADGMILVFDVTRSSSFSNVKNWYNTAIKYGLSGIPKILVGNKIDLEKKRKIIVPMIKHLANELNCPYFETSALTGKNVKTLFENLAKILLEYKQRKK
jgi:Ras-related protein Rab-1A